MLCLPILRHTFICSCWENSSPLSLYILFFALSPPHLSTLLIQRDEKTFHQWPGTLCGCPPLLPLPLSDEALSPSNRLGSLLLDSLKEHISTTAQDHCKAIYLHVLTTNNTAIHFYENRDFRQHHYLPYYYSIRGVLKDGFTYVLYINGGHPPWTILYPFVEAGEKVNHSLCLTRTPKLYLPWWVESITSWLVISSNQDVIDRARISVSSGNRTHVSTR